MMGLQSIFYLILLGGGLPESLQIEDAHKMPYNNSWGISSTVSFCPRVYIYTFPETNSASHLKWMVPGRCSEMKDGGPTVTPGKFASSQVRCFRWPPTRSL